MQAEVLVCKQGEGANVDKGKGGTRGLRNRGEEFEKTGITRERMLVDDN